MRLVVHSSWARTAGPDRAGQLGKVSSATVRRPNRPDLLHNHPREVGVTPGSRPKVVRMRLLVAGRLRLVDPIGDGGSGTVWRAWDVCSQRYVAAKLHTRAVPEPVDVRHPNVLTPHEWL